MQLHNTLGRQLQEFKPLKRGHVSLYTCGPTVYHYYHIGNLRNAVFNDTLKRTLLLNDYHVNHVMNITDVGHLSSDADEGEDKLQSKANEEGKSVWEVAEFYTDAFKQDMQRLNILPPTQYVRATDTIDQQVAMIQTLIDKGFAYPAKQAIYFEVSKLGDYGKLTGQKLTEKETGARKEVITDPQKRNPADFALWFFTMGHFKDHTMRWPSPWGEGFPGWHLECSAIIESKLGRTIDIHTGGVDHIGTHHTNEIAQSEAAHDGAPLANYWIHNEFLLVDGKKMSKSLRNVFTLTDVINRSYDPLALRLLFLQSHYRTQQDFSWEALDGAASYLSNLRSWADSQFQSGSATLPDDKFERVFRQMKSALDHDLNTPQALAATSLLIDTLESQNLTPTAEQVAHIDSWTGLRLTEREDISPEQKTLIREREEAREASDYATADEARIKLLDSGIAVDDTATGPRWRRTNQ